MSLPLEPLQSIPRSCVQPTKRIAGKNVTHNFNSSPISGRILDNLAVPALVEKDGNLLTKQPIVGSNDYNGWKKIIDTYLKNAQ